MKRGLFLRYLSRSRHNVEQRKRWRERGAKTAATIRARRRRYNAESREKLLTIYGGYCVCCGEKERAFLEFDHVFNDGVAERKRVGRDFHTLFNYLRKLGFPRDRWQVLCANCHAAKTRFGFCPHAPLRSLCGLRIENTEHGNSAFVN